MFERPRHEEVQREQAAPPAVVAAPAHTPLAWLARQPVERRASVLHALSRTAGNHAVARAVATDGAGGAAPRSTGAGAGPADPQIDIASATPEEKWQELPKALARGDASAVGALWESFGDVRAAATGRESLFVESANLATYLWDHFTEEQDAFKRAVEGLALEHLSANRDYVTGEMSRLGIDEGPAAKASPEQADAMRQTQELAKLAEDALKAKQSLLAIPVARVFVAGDAPTWVTMTFNPQVPQSPGPDDEPGDKTWIEVMLQWDRSEQLLADIQATSPGVFATIQGGGATAAGDLASADPASAAAYLEASLSRLMKKLEETAGDVGGRYAWDSLPMLHPQALATGPFTETLAHGAARHAMHGAGEGKAAAEAALSGIGIVAAMIGIFATGGMAAALAVVGAAATGMQAGISVADYDKLADLRAARTGDASHDLVDAETVDAAKGRAIVDTIFAFLDTVEAVKALRELGGGAGVLEKLGKFGELDTVEQAKVLGAAMEQMGEAKALERVGGIAEVRATLAGSPAARRAEVYSKRFVDELADELGAREAREAATEELLTGLAAPAPAPARTPEQLTQKAHAFAARQTGMSGERALQVVAPQVANADALVELAARAIATGEELSADYAQLTSAEARMQRVHDIACAQARVRNLPSPEKAIGTANTFNAQSWTITYDARLFQKATVSNQEWEILRGIGMHEMRHGEQFTELVRYARGRGMTVDQMAGALHIHPDAVAAVATQPPLVLGQPGFEHAEEWFESIYGGAHAETGVRYRDSVLARMESFSAMTDARLQAHADLAAAHKAISDASQAGEDATRMRELNDAARAADAKARQWDDLVARREPEIRANYQQYRNLPEEQDAWKVQGSYQKALARMRQGEAMQRYEAEAAAATAAGAARPAPPPTPASSEPLPRFKIEDEEEIWGATAPPEPAHR